MDAPLLAALASIITAVAVLITSIAALRGQRQIGENVERVHDEVKTTNGITMAALADRAEGRRIVTDVPPEDRTTSEQGYVDNLDEGGRNVGHGPGEQPAPPPA